ncbi:MAG: hypothetical protein WDN10_04430 [bacterium]
MQTTGDVNFLNLEWWFRLIYELAFGSHSFSSAGFGAFLSRVWLWVTVVGSIVAVLSLVVIAYCIMRLFELRKKESEALGPVIHLAKDNGANPRWVHIQSLMDGANPSQWREAILEADILLEDMLKEQRYTGAGVGEMLKQVERSDFNTLDAAWEAHRVRNDIAHRGSTIELTEQLARRTIAKYESVFREFDMI